MLCSLAGSAGEPCGCAPCRQLAMIACVLLPPLPSAPQGEGLPCSAERHQHLRAACAAAAGAARAVAADPA
eukprot:scaffold183168_cov10-Tisochrysis_lutea.AAC.1